MSNLNKWTAALDLEDAGVGVVQMGGVPVALDVELDVLVWQAGALRSYADARERGDHADQVAVWADRKADAENRRISREAWRSCGGHDPLWDTEWSQEVTVRLHHGALLSYEEVVDFEDEAILRGSILL